MLRFLWQLYRLSPPALRRVIARIVRLVGPVVGIFRKSVQISSTTMYLNFSDQAAFRYLRHGKDYEEDLVQIVLRAVSLNGPVAFLDVGASYGFYTLSVASIGRFGLVKRIVAYEPDARCVGALNRSLEVNGFGGFASVEHQLVGDYLGTGKMFQSLQASTSNRSFETDTGYFHYANVEEVPATTIDESLVGHEIDAARTPIVVKMDVEGNEHRVLKGMQQTLSDARALFLLLEFFPVAIREVGSTAEEFIAPLRAVPWTTMEMRHEGNWRKYRDASAFFRDLAELFEREKLNHKSGADVVLARGMML